MQDLMESFSSRPTPASIRSTNPLHSSTQLNISPAKRRRVDVGESTNMEQLTNATNVDFAVLRHPDARGVGGNDQEEGQPTTKTPRVSVLEVLDEIDPQEEADEDGGYSDEDMGMMLGLVPGSKDATNVPGMSTFSLAMT